MQNAFLPPSTYSFFNQKCCLILIWYHLPKKMNSLLDQRLPQTLNKRIEGNSLCCVMYWRPLGLMHTPSMSSYFRVTLMFSPSTFESGKQNSCVNPNSICIAQKRTSHLSELPPSWDPSHSVQILLFPIQKYVL